MEEGETEKILNLINEKIGSKQRIIGYIWEADGIRHKGKLLKYDHLGVVVDKEARGEDVGFAIYRLHEAVFGERKKEITPKLSILKLYMKLGFVPKKIINPENGEELPIRAGKMVEGNFSKGNENFVFLVYLEKEKEN